jgi:hypothetical protein
MPNKIYVAPETPVNFLPQGGEVAFPVNGLLYGSGYLSDRLDLGSGSRPYLFEWRAKVTTEGGATVGDAVEIYLATSDGATTDGNFSAAAQVVTTPDSRRNLRYVGAVVAEHGGVSGVFCGAGLTQVRARHVQVGWFNYMAAQLSTQSGAFAMSLTPVPEAVG